MKKVEEKAKQSIRLEYKLTMNLIQDIFKFYFCSTFWINLNNSLDLPRKRTRDASQITFLFSALHSRELN